MNKIDIYGKKIKVRKCKCGKTMEQIGFGSDTGQYWCPHCGTLSQSYACEDTVWKIPLNKSACFKLIDDIEEYTFDINGNNILKRIYKKIKQLRNILK